MKKSAPHLVTEIPRRRTRVETTIGIDLGDVWSHYCTLNQDGEVFCVNLLFTSTLPAAPSATR